MYTAIPYFLYMNECTYPQKIRLPQKHTMGGSKHRARARVCACACAWAQNYSQSVIKIKKTSA